MPFPSMMSTSPEYMSVDNKNQLDNILYTKLTPYLRAYGSAQTPVPINQTQSMGALPEEVTPQVTQQPTGFDLSKINWDALAKLFQNPQATTAFYKTALGMLTDLLSQQRQAEALAIQRQQAMALERYRDIQPLVELSNYFGNQYAKYAEALKDAKLSGNTQAEIAIADQMRRVQQQYDLIQKELLKRLGVALPEEPTPQLPSPQAPVQSPAPQDKDSFFRKLGESLNAIVKS